MRENMTMKNLRKLTTRSAAVMILAASFSPVSAQADSSATPTPIAAVATAAVADFSAVQAAYKAALDTYSASKQTAADFKNLVQAFNAFQSAYKDQVKAINQAFKDAALVARNNFQSGLAGAKTAAAKAKNRATRDSALVSATLARDNAIAALGALPTRPIKAAKVAK